MQKTYIRSVPTLEADMAAKYGAPVYLSLGTGRDEPLLYQLLMLFVKAQASTL